MPEIHQRHKHVKTKYIHVYHPKKVHSDHSYLHARHDPNIGLLNGGYPQPLVNINNRKPELRITEDEFLKWQQDQAKKALDDRRKFQDEQSNQNDNEEDDNSSFDTQGDVSEGEEEKFTDELYKKHKANKANSSYRNSSKHKNHNYNQDYEASNTDKNYAKYPSRNTNKKQTYRPVSAVQLAAERPRKSSQQKPYRGFQRHQNVEASNLQPQFYIAAEAPTSADPTYYSTIPKDQISEGTDNQDDIYSGLLSARYNKSVVDKSKLLADINYNRKKQNKIVTSQNRRSQ